MIKSNYLKKTLRAIDPNTYDFFFNSCMTESKGQCRLFFFKIAPFKSVTWLSIIYHKEATKINIIHSIIYEKTRAPITGND